MNKDNFVQLLCRIIYKTKLHDNVLVITSNSKNYLCDIWYDIVWKIISDVLLLFSDVIRKILNIKGR